MKNLNRIICAVVLLAICCFSSFAGAKKDAPTVASPKADELRVGILNGPTSIPSAYLLENLPSIEGVAVTFETFADPQALLPKMIRGEIDVGFMPPNVAAKTYNDGNAAVICVGVSGYGNLSLITKDTDVHALSDLRGKKVSVAGQGSTPEYLFRYLLRENGISDAGGSDGVEFDFSIPNANIAAALISDQISYAVVPEPFATVATTRSQSVVRAIDLQREFVTATGGDNFPLTVMVVRNEFAKTDSDTVKKFADAFAGAVTWTVANPASAGNLVEKHTLGLASGVVAKAIPFANFTWQNAASARAQIESLLKIFLSFAPASIGGKLPDEGFYLN